MRTCLLYILLFYVTNFSLCQIIPDSLLSKSLLNNALMNGSDSMKKVPDIYINRIIIAGNEVTDEDIITRELTIKENEKLDLNQLQKDVERLYKLNLFNKVDVYPVPTDTLDRYNVLFVVEERFYIIPLPQGGFRNGEFSKFWIGANVTWHNFRGRNETTSLRFGIGYEPFINFSYSVPWIGRYEHYFSSFSLAYAKNYNRSLLALNDTTSNTIPSSDSNFAIYSFNTGISVGKYLANDFSIETGLRYTIGHTSKYEPGRTLSPDGRDDFFTFSAIGRYDTRNSIEYTLAGVLLSLEYKRYGFGHFFDFNRVNYESKTFIPISITSNYFITFATRFFGTISFGGDIPYYLDEYFGYDKIVRGYKKIVSEGENQLGLFNEIRIPIIDPLYFKGKTIPGVNKISMLKKLNYKFGLYSTIFFDLGGVWNKDNNFFDTEFIHGFGTGLNFILPFGFIGRTDFAFRKEQKRFVPQIIFDLGASF